jgi:hypothetical protein
MASPCRKPRFFRRTSEKSAVLYISSILVKHPALEFVAKAILHFDGLSIQRVEFALWMVFEHQQSDG